MQEQDTYTLDWQDFLEHHSVFYSLGKQDIADILVTSVSAERQYPAGQIILRQGEAGDKVFLIAAGTVKVALQPQETDKEIDLIALERGDIFGEMALLEDKPRSATARAMSDCTLLQIDGKAFHTLVQHHPEIEFKLLSILSQRVRQINNKILAIQQMDVDAKLDLFNSKLNAELKVFDAALDAAQTVFEQINIRTNEVITRAERSQYQAKLFVTAVGTVFTTLGLLLGWFGLNQYNNLIAAVETIKGEVEESHQEVEHSKAQVKTHLAEISEVNQVAQQVRPILTQVNSLNQAVSQQRLYQFKEALNTDNPNQALMSYGHLLEPDTNLALKEIELRMTRKVEGRYEDFTPLLLSLLNATPSFGDKAQVYFLLLSNAILVDRDQFKNGQSFEQVLAEFQTYLHRNQGPGMRINPSTLETVFADQSSPIQQKRFAQVKQLLPTP